MPDGEGTSSDTLRERAARIVHNIGSFDAECVYVLAGAEEPCVKCQRAIQELERLGEKVETWKHEADVMKDAAEKCRAMEAERDRLHDALEELVALHDGHSDAEAFWVDVGHLIEEHHPDGSGPVRRLLEEIEQGDTVARIRREAREQVEHELRDMGMDMAADVVRGLNIGDALADDDQEDEEDA